MTQFGPIYPHDGGSKPVWLEDETPIRVGWRPTADFPEVNWSNPGAWTPKQITQDTYKERGWKNVVAYRLPLDHWANAPLAAGMTPWPGGDEAPGDLDRIAPVMMRDGHLRNPSSIHRWNWMDKVGDIIGYTPRRATVTEPAPDPMAALNERAWALVEAVAAERGGNWRHEASKVLADRAKLTVDPDVLVVREEVARSYEDAGWPNAARRYRDGEHDEGMGFIAALACYRLGKETAK